VRVGDNDPASFGAEALPGGLRDINDAREGRPQASPPAPALRRRTPLVGLIALVTQWLGEAGKRR